MRRTLRAYCVPALLAMLILMIAETEAEGQIQPPRIGLIAVDIRGSLPSLPDDPDLAASRGLNVSQLPERALGVEVGIHLYPVRWKAVTFGIGGHGTLARARFSPDEGVAFTPVYERLVSLASHLSLNFGTGDGWSYISGGIGRTNWRIVPEGAILGPADKEQIYTVNYGGGARWFSTPHVGFTFDVRVHTIAPGTSYLGRPGSPYATLLVLSAGVSLK